MKRLTRWWVLGTVVLLWGLLLGAAPAAETPKSLGLTKEKPIKVDEKAKSLSVLAEVNGKYFLQATRHGLVFKDGKNGEKSVLRALGDHKSFHEGLIKLGFKAGNNMTMDNAATTFVQGDPLEVTVSWEGAKKEYRLDEVIKDSNGKPLLIKFGGNLESALKYNTGCLICLDSCPVGITSNASYTMGAIEKRNEVSFTGIKEVLPPDGTQVVVTLKAKK
jgi:hypothetical protein